MKIIDWIRGLTLGGPRAATQESGGGRLVTTAAELEEAMRGGATASGVVVTPGSAMRVATVYGCVRIISGAVANLPLDLKRKVNAKTREDADDEPISDLLKRRPNRWQTPSQFKRMMQAHVLLRGNGYGLIARGFDGRPLEVVPMHPDKVDVKQLSDLSIVYEYTRDDGRTVLLKQSEVFHLVGMTLDGVRGVSPITFARETIGLSMAQDQHGTSTFRNGARISNVLSHPNKLGKEGLENLRGSLSAYRAGGENEGKDLVLEEGMKVEPMGMKSTDAQWLESRKFSRTEIAMFFGVPPHMLGDTEKSTSWGSGIEQQGQGFIQYTLEDHLTMWEETVRRDLIPERRRDLYARFNRSALVRGDIKSRYAAHAIALQWGFKSPDEIRADEDLNPRPDGEGEKFYDPPNTAGGKSNGDATSDNPNAP